MNWHSLRTATAARWSSVRRVRVTVSLSLSDAGEMSSYLRSLAISLSRAASAV